MTTREELAQQVAAVHEAHGSTAHPDGTGYVASTNVDGRPPTDDETSVLLLDKLIATADAFGMKTEPDDWRQVSPTRFEHAEGATTFVFDGDLGMMVTAAHRSDMIEIHHEDDVAAAVEAIGEPQPVEADQE